jgi:hypothetical protein
LGNRARRCFVEPALRPVSRQLRNASAGAVFVLLSGAAANAAGVFDDAIALVPREKGRRLSRPSRSTSGPFSSARKPIPEREAPAVRIPFPPPDTAVRLSPRQLAAFLSPCETALRREQRQRHRRFLFRFWLLRLFSLPVGSSLPFCHNTLPYVDHSGGIIYASIIWERFQILLHKSEKLKEIVARAIIVS